MTPLTVFYAGRTRRWHQNPWLSDTNDHLDGHQGRVARLCLALWSDCSRDLLAAALTHDDGEYATGDIAAPVVKTPEQTAAERRERHGVWGWHIELDHTDEARLHFADRLDAFMWAKHHRPWVMKQPDWVSSRGKLILLANRLDVDTKGALE